MEKQTKLARPPHHAENVTLNLTQEQHTVLLGALKEARRLDAEMIAQSSDESEEGAIQTLAGNIILITDIIAQL